MSEKNHRLFFALWPDKTLRNKLQDQLKPFLSKHPAKKVPQHNWHITLAFLGSVTAEVKQCAQSNAGMVKTPAFDLILDKSGFFKRARVAWLGSQQCPEALSKLVEHLNQQLAPCGYQAEHKIYVPHMTVLRKAQKGLGIDSLEPIHWPVKEFVLVESITDQRGAIYQVIDRWSLE